MIWALWNEDIKDDPNVDGVDEGWTYRRPQ